MSEQAQEYWDAQAKAIKEQGSGEGGGGTIGYGRVETGWKVMASGIPQGESWFPCDNGDKRAIAVAKKAAQKLAKETGAKFYYGIGIVLPADKSFSRGEAATWSTPELVRFTANFWTAFDEVLIPSLVENNIRVPWEGWMQVLGKADPNAVENDLKDEQGRYKQTYYVAATFKNKVLAMKAVAEMPKGDDSSSDVPDKYTPEDWESFKPAILEQLETESVEEVADAFEVELRYIQAIADSVVPV